jgi:hypothetical protein
MRCGVLEESEGSSTRRKALSTRGWALEISPGSLPEGKVLEASPMLQHAEQSITRELVVAPVRDKKQGA